MAITQKYGIKYPFTSDNDENVYLDLNQTRVDRVTSDVLHVIFTPKGQKIRNPEFGTDLIRYIFDQNDEITLADVKTEATSQVLKYVPGVELRNIDIYKQDVEIIVTVEFGVKRGDKTEITTVGVKL